MKLSPKRNLIAVFVVALGLLDFVEWCRLATHVLSPENIAKLLGTIVTKA
jgi:hypothetical protein